MKKKICK